MNNPLRSIAKWVRPVRWKFSWRYWRGRTPWDTDITPPEVMAFIDSRPPGRALDLGCGTGTNAITLAGRGWDVVGVDFAANAIRSARRKSAAAGLDIDFFAADVTDLGFLNGTFDYILDIGCLFTLKAGERDRYAGSLARLAGPRGRYMLYAWLPHERRGRPRGISPEEVDALIGKTFQMQQVVKGEDKGLPSAWYWYRKR